MKILLITHNPTSTTNNMGKTFLSLFYRFDKVELCQLYINPSYPDVKVCNSYYRITDFEALKSIYSFKKPGGEVLLDHEYSGVEIIAHSVRNKNSALKRLMRDMVWRLSRWYSCKLRDWLDREQPTHIFVAPGYAKFIYDIALKISLDYDLPIVTYICDDYYFVKEPKDWISRLQLACLKKKTRRLLEKTQYLVVISQELKEQYCASFGVNADVIMTGSDIKLKKEKSEEEIQSLSYFGNLSAGRNISLSDIGHELDAINREYGKEIKLRIYTSETSPERLSAFDGIDSIDLQGFVSGKKFESKFLSSDMLVHVESFQEENIDLVKHSVSTKIADSLASGIPLFAYGPKNISSMRHLIHNECAVIVTSREELQAKLKEVIFDPKMSRITVENAIKAANKYHDKERNSAKLKSIFADIRKI